MRITQLLDAVSTWWRAFFFSSLSGNVAILQRNMRRSEFVALPQQRRWRKLAGG
jgi:hypothetical protein